MKTRKRINKKRKTRKRVFKNDDYKSNDGMLTAIWGPGMWHFLHSMSFNYPVNPTQEEKENYRDFMLSLKNILPCGKCRKNLRSNYKRLPITMNVMKSRDTFSRYVYDLHELINGMLDKKSGLSYEDIRERYEHFRSRCNGKKQKVKEKGCVTPVYGEKSKCILKIIPAKEKCDTLQIDERCNKKLVK
tara:strand:+ start:364 stop:927 length:564 start_codon:yes stop_codon:yes gene_type:complete